MTVAQTRPAEGSTSHERRISTALFAAGLATFATMYSTQALLPSLSAAFGAAPAHAALAVSLTTGFLALAIIPVSALSSRIGRTRVMTVSAVSSAAIGLMLPFSPSLEVLLAGRALQGLTLAGVPAVAMAYLAEEIRSEGLGAAMGVYVAGTSMGGLAGRVVPAFALGVGSWRWAEASISVAAAVCTLWFVRRLPPSRGFVARPAGIRTVVGDLIAQLRHRGLLALFGLAVVLVGGFVSLYNFLGYRLTQPPFELPDAVAGLVFTLYLAGTASSAVAGRLADRIGRPRVLLAVVVLMAVGLAMTVPDNLVAVIVGIGLCTAGFFGAHSVASAWVGVLARGNRGAASSLYLFSFYVGSAVIGGASGIAFTHHGWLGLVLCVAALLVVAAILVGALMLREGARRTEPGQVADALSRLDNLDREQ
ncbi:putative MFS family arabinose efflux permease [Nocardia tenerifensis]|uniref:Putative MFS family arabinose efflux permease n=1 Tax=Nocardia tenerifensis TaxID=228006 RepID=A0A318K0K5_9NOCA|nr:MFS transporter [Nocardia tenerifensis]PXX60295.1 putative MFS family arabinose efflux permease [Nocardia tenerifensis]